MSQQGAQELISDLRMGQEPAYTFAFAVAQRRADGLVPVAVPTMVGRRPDISRAMAWLWRRARGEPVAPPR